MPCRSWISRARASSLPTRLAASASRWPLAANCRAASMPMPLDAPVMRMAFGSAMFVAVRDRHASVAAEGARRDLDARRKLAAFVFAEVDQPKDFFCGGLIHAGLAEFAEPAVFFHIERYDAVQQIVGRERVLVRLVRAKFGRRRTIEDA